MHDSDFGLDAISQYVRDRRDSALQWCHTTRPYDHVIKPTNRRREKYVSRWTGGSRVSHSSQSDFDLGPRSSSNNSWWLWSIASYAKIDSSWSWLTWHYGVEWRHPEAYISHLICSRVAQKTNVRQKQMYNTASVAGLPKKQMYDSVITGKGNASKEWNYIVSMFLTSYNVCFVFGYAYFMC